MDQDIKDLEDATRANNKDRMAETVSEIHDDQAGVSTGILLKMYVSGTRSYEETRNDLFHGLCDF
jgi:hypothetical protein